MSTPPADVRSCEFGAAMPVGQPSEALKKLRRPSWVRYDSAAACAISSAAFSAFAGSSAASRSCRSGGSMRLRNLSAG